MNILKFEAFDFKKILPKSLTTQEFQQYLDFIKDNRENCLEFTDIESSDIRYVVGHIKSIYHYRIFHGVDPYLMSEYLIIFKDEHWDHARERKLSKRKFHIYKVDDIIPKFLIVNVIEDLYFIADDFEELKNFLEILP